MKKNKEETETAMKKEFYVECQIIQGSRGRTYDTSKKYLQKDWTMKNKKYLMDYDTAMSLIEFHFPDILFDDKKIEVEYNIVHNKTRQVAYNCMW